MMPIELLGLMRTTEHLDQVRAEWFGIGTHPGPIHERRSGSGLRAVTGRFLVWIGTRIEPRDVARIDRPVIDQPGIAGVQH